MKLMKPRKISKQEIHFDDDDRLRVKKREYNYN